MGIYTSLHTSYLDSRTNNTPTQNIPHHRTLKTTCNHMMTRYRYVPGTVITISCCSSFSLCRCVCVRALFAFTYRASTIPSQNNTRFSIRHVVCWTCKYPRNVHKERSPDDSRGGEIKQNQDEERKEKQNKKSKPKGKGRWDAEMRGEHINKV